MPQKPLNVKKGVLKKKTAANKHGKGGTATKKGAKAAAPKRSRAIQQSNESNEITKIINSTNEERAAGAAVSSGARLKMVKADAPPAASKVKASKKNKTAEMAKKAVKSRFVL
eukprot:jgi/Ulvmu1/9656/UM054_0088.1